jgi:hypothetical protein
MLQMLGQRGACCLIVKLEQLKQLKQLES